MKNIDIGRYLLEQKHWSSASRLIELTVIEVSNTSVKVRHESGYTEWMTKDAFIYNYKLIERL